MIPEIDGSSIVLLGAFNLAIFHPLWFKINQLIRPEEADAAKLEVTHPAVSIFSLEWFKLQVEMERFVVETTDKANFGPISDLVLGTFSILDHTPVRALGINRMMHFKMESIEEWHAFGHMLAPKDVWHGIMDRPGLRSLTMDDPRDDPAGYIRVRIEPLNRVDPGIFIEVNNHYEIKENSVQNMLYILKSSWKDVLLKSENIANHLIRRG
ncbi:MAG: hypothetical protein AB1502_09645 [Thermodesulfobacteriota bacterium]